MARAAELDAPSKVKNPSGTPFGSVPAGRPFSKASITWSIGPTSSTAGAPVPSGRTSDQPHISVSVRPSLGAPGGWKSVARWKDENGMRTRRHPLVLSAKLRSNCSYADILSPRMHT